MGTVFSAYDIRGRLGENISKEYVWTLGKSFAEWSPEEEKSLLVVSSSEANQDIVRALVEGITLQGRNVVTMTGGDEQTVVLGIADNQAAGGVLITHDSTDMEVIALYDAQGIAITAENGLSNIGELVESGNFLPAAVKGEVVSK